jgi:hypothetical protein
MKKKVVRKSKSKVYFSKDTEEAIILYNNSDDSDEREIIYRESIEYPLDKLAENVINRFKFPYINQSFDDTKRQVISFLITNLHKYTQGKGKAFSYFSVIAKNYLILHNNNGWREEKRSISLSDSGDMVVSIDEASGMEAPNELEHEDVREFVQLFIGYWDENVLKHFKKKRDIEIVVAIVELFRKVNGIENFNKKALYLMIREMTNCKTNYVTKVVQKMKKHVLLQLREFHEFGTVGKMNIE